MKKIRLLFAAVLSMMAWTGAVAQTNAEYEAALAAITDGGNYRISTEVNGAKYYLDPTGYLKANKSDGKIFTFTKVNANGTLYASGWNLGCKFTNPSLSNGSTGDVVNDGHIHVGGNDRNDWERQVFFKKDDAYAVRSTNANSANWGANTYWCVTNGDLPKAEYSLSAAYVWQLEEVLASVSVTYEVYDGETLVGSATTIQDANSEVAIPSSLTGITYQGGWTPNANYKYTAEGTIGTSDCTIKVVRTPASGLVHALTDLSNAKAYNIYCKRGAMLTDGTTIASTSHATLHDATPANFAFVSYENNYYIYSVADKKFVLNTGYLSALPTNGKYDAIQMDAKTDPFFLFTFKINDTTSHGVNTNGTGALKGCVINTWTTPDDGDQYYMI